MRKKLDTRFPASRIKKIMQADDDVGKIALPVPVLVSKALELFLQDLCDRTYDITLQKGLKTVSALHLKQCVHSYNVFDFLKDTVSKVPDLGGPDAGGDDRSSKRRKAADESNESDEDLKRFKTQDKTASQCSSSASSRGRGRGRGRGRPRGSGRGGERDGAQSDRFVDDDPDTSLLQHNNDNRPVDLTKSFEKASDATEQKETTNSGSNTLATGSGGIVRNFDLNLDLDENGDAFAATATATATSSSSVATTVAAATTTTTTAAHHHQMKHEEFTGWPLSDIDRMAMDSHRFSMLNTTIQEEEEDYDNE